MKTNRDWWDLAKKAWGSPQIRNKETDTEVFYVIIGDELRLSFRSTDMNLKDWLYNFRILKEPFIFKGRKILCHRGFFEKYLSVRKEIMNLTHGISKISVTGISQGAAVALICALDVYDSLNILPEGRSYCTPKAFNLAGAKIFEEAIPEYKIFNSKNDLVTKSPPWWLGFFQPKKNVFLIDNCKPWGIFRPWIYHQPSYYAKMMFGG